MMKPYFALIATISMNSFCFAAPTFLGEHRLSKLQCPFGCSQGIKEGFKKARKHRIRFTQTSAELPSPFGCASPATADFKSLEKFTTLGQYLTQWSDNEEGNAHPEIRRRLPEKLGYKADQEVRAGLVRCSDGTTFNLIVIDDRHQILLFEENSYWEMD